MEWKCRFLVFKIMRYKNGPNLAFSENMKSLPCLYLTFTSLFVMQMLLFFVLCCSVSFLIVLTSSSIQLLTKLIKIINSKCKISRRQTALEIVILACFWPIIFQPLQLLKSNKMYDPCNNFSRNIVIENVWSNMNKPQLNISS